MYPDSRLHVVWTSVCFLKPQQTETTSCMMLAKEGTMRMSSDTTVRQLHRGPWNGHSKDSCPSQVRQGQGSFLILVMRSLASDCKSAMFPDTSTALDHSTSRTLSNKTSSAYYQLKSWTSPKFTSTNQNTRLSRETLTSHQGWVNVLREAMGGNCSIAGLELVALLLNSCRASVVWKTVCFPVLLELSWCQGLQQVLKVKNTMRLPWTRASGHRLSGNLPQSKW